MSDYCFEDVMCFIIIAFLFGLLAGLPISYYFICNPIEKLNLNEDSIAEYHVLKYYPEFENCTFKYRMKNQIDCREESSQIRFPGVEVYCNEIIDNRDGMRVLEYSEPNMTLCFENVTLNEILEEIVSEYK